MSPALTCVPFAFPISAGKMLIAGLDQCQRLSGIALKLLAFERLLQDYE
jgi:trehalose-6-phosphate synthase